MRKKILRSSDSSQNVPIDHRVTCESSMFSTIFWNLFLRSMIRTVTVFRGPFLRFFHRLIHTTLYSAQSATRARFTGLTPRFMDHCRRQEQLEKVREGEGRNVLS